jgi:hypothetical protein
MQFTRTYLGPDVDDEMNELLGEIEANGPYHFVKLSHHGATNGQDEALMRSWGAKLLGITTGSKSHQHPTPATIAALKELKADGFKWVRTDMNGLCTYTLSNSGAGSLSKQRGVLSDTTEPANRDAAEIEGGPAPGKQPEPVVRTVDGHVEVTIRIPNRKTRVSFSIDIDPGAQPALGDDTRPFR